MLSRESLPQICGAAAVSLEPRQSRRPEHGFFLHRALCITRQPLGLYLHIPFCASICSYCNFNRGLLDAELKTRYVDALVARNPPRGGWQPSADTIFFGGGTPSLLEPEEVGRLITACRESFDVDRRRRSDARDEPGDGDGRADARLSAMPASIASASACSRSSTRSCSGSGGSTAAGAPARRSQTCAAAGFDNVSLDLMMWLPAAAPARVAGHGRRPHRARAGPRVALPARALSERAAAGGDGAQRAGRSRPTTTRPTCTCGRWRRLDAAGYAQYEISNVARPGRESRHNLKYWHDGAWLGFGCGAHSTRGPLRWKNVAGTDEYVERVWPPVAASASSVRPARRRSDSRTHCSRGFA